jgi:ribonuclease J
VSEVPRGELMVLASGTQAEPGAALTRLAAREHQQLQLEAGDAVVMSSRIIPGNDRKVVRMMGGLLRQGVRVHSTFSDPGIHASGHAAREEQQRMLELIRPRTFLPVHGTRHHLTRHAELARSLGVEQVQVVENGQSVRLDDDGLHLGPVVHSGRVSVGFGGSELPPNTLAERGDIARNGVAVFSIVLDGRGTPRGEPRLSLLGVPGMAAPGACDALARRIGDGLGEQLARWHKRGLDKQQELARLVRSHIERRTGTRPRVEVQLLEP